MVTDFVVLWYGCGSGVCGDIEFAAGGVVVADVLEGGGDGGGVGKGGFEGGAVAVDFVVGEEGVQQEVGVGGGDCQAGGEG